MHHRLIIIMPKNFNRANKIPKFIKNLNNILQDKEYAQVISYLTENNGFQILNSSRFIDEVLPKYFKHNNMASFVRQLNMYGFNRPKESDQHVYTNPKFIKGNLNSMRQIQRRANDRNTLQSQQSCQEAHQQSINSECSNQELSEVCRKLNEQNQELKKMNNYLIKKLEELSGNRIPVQVGQLIAESTGNMQTNETNQIFDKQTRVQEKHQAISQQRKREGFSFGFRHQDWNSRLSYLSLIDGARDVQKNDRVMNSF